MPVFCFICEKSFSNQGNLNKHQKQVHDKITQFPVEYDENCCLFKCLEGCKISFKKNSDLREHLKQTHTIENQVYETSFATYADFKIWLKSEEENNNLRFKKGTGVKKCSFGLEKIYFDCIRSGKSRLNSKVENGKRKRYDKSQGTNKLDKYCTSQIILTRNVESEECFIKYFKSHYGHDTDLQHLPISQIKRETVASQLLLGVSPSHILDTTRNNIGTQLKRDDLLTRKDIHNIKVSYNVQINDGRRHKCDSESVRLWVEEIKNHENNPVLFYKNYLEECQRYKLDKKDFCIILMNNTQMDLLIKFGRNIICVDSTHGLNAYDYELSTILVIDEFGNGFPCAFMFTNRKDAYAFEIFFSEVKQKSGQIATKVFMSDITNVSFNPWKNIMGDPEKRLLCSWHVDQAWQRNLKKVRDSEKQKWIYQTLKYLQNLLDEEQFENEFTKFLCMLQKDEIEMYNYLSVYYAKNVQEWAYCYRKCLGINTNMHLESLHKTIKYAYLSGKKVKRLDKTLHAIQKCIRDKILERIIKLVKNKNPHYSNIINSRHRIAVTMKPQHYDVIKDNDNFSLFNKEKNITYFIEDKKIQTCCNLSCNFCNICVHTFECSCTDYHMKPTICKHIHFLCLKNNISQITNYPKSTDLEKKNVEVNGLMKQFSCEKTVPSLKEQIKSVASEVIFNMNNKNYSQENLEQILKNLKVAASICVLPELSFTSTFEVDSDVLSEPSNMKIEKQTSFPIKKKRIKDSTIKTKPDANSKNVIKATLNQEIFISYDSNNDHDY